MPRNVRNFWLSLTVDGRRTSIATGPRSRNGGFSLRIFMRSNGGVTEAANLDGEITPTGELLLTYTANGELGAAPPFPGATTLITKTLR